MFGTMGFSELIIILVIVLIIFGAGRLPQIGEGVGKALKGFKKEVNEMPPPVDPNAPDEQPTPQISSPPEQTDSPTPSSGPQSESSPTGTPSNQPYKPGPELTPGTTAALLYKGAGPETVTPKQSQGAQGAQGTPQSSSQGAAASVPPPVTMEQRAAQANQTAAPQYPPLPSTARPQPITKRPSAVVNKQAVARVQAQQAALKEKQQQASANPQDMQSLGEGLGGALRTFREAANDVRSSIDPEMKTIQAELESAEKEVQETIESAKQPILPKDPPSTT
jgi:TatA/E family protein of Tat protein translocase